MNYFYYPLDKEKLFNKNQINDEAEEKYNKYLKDSIDNYRNERKKYKNNNLKLLLRIKRDTLKENDCLKLFKSTLNYYLKQGLKPSDFVYSFDNDFCKKTLSNKELYNLSKLDEMAKKVGATVGIFDYRDVFSYDQVKNADAEIKHISNLIQKRNFSPLEKLLYAYLIVSDLQYKEENKKSEPISLSRSVYGILNSDKIVCGGYNEYLKSIVREIDDLNLKVFSNYVGTQDYNKKGILETALHANNIVYIKDDKYKIDGFYYLDSTWDYKNKNSLTFFLAQIGQIKNIYSKIIDWSEASKILEDIKKNKSKKNVAKNHKSKDKFAYNYGWREYASVSSGKLEFGGEIKNIGENDREIADDTLTEFLFSRQDFKDHVTLWQTKSDMRDIKESFDDIFEANAKAVEADLHKMPILANSVAMFKYLEDHSDHIDIGTVQNALQVVTSKLNPDKSKDEISKMVYDALKFNIWHAKGFYKRKETLWTECENLKEIKEELKK